MSIVSPAPLQLSQPQAGIKDASIVQVRATDDPERGSSFTVQPKPVPRGTPAFEARRAALIDTIKAKVPSEYFLPAELIANPPLDVSNIPSSCGILTEDEVRITEDYDAVGLLHAIASRQFSAVEVATAFAKRSIIAHQLTCCLTQWLMDEAIAQARGLDEYMAKHGKPIGPLHGLPISIKEHMAIAGTLSSQGCLASLREDTTDSDMVAILRSLGAVFYCKTNQPQTIMHLETDSLWGRTLNPFNINLSAGGSTGGEAALIAMKGSVLGIGTDIGGSIRGPAAFCGIYGFKPTSYTMPMRGFDAMPFPAELTVLASAGPMCRSLRDMDLLMHCVLSSKPHLKDPRLVPIPWNGLKTPINGRLKIGFVNNDGCIIPQPPVVKALAWAREQLCDPRYSDLIELKDFKVFDSAGAWSKIRRMYWPDGGKPTRDAIQATGEPIHPLSDWIWKDAEPLGMKTAVDLSLMRRERDEFRWAFAKSWEDQDVDILIGPAFVGPASAHDTAFFWNYTSLYNLVDYPGVVIPTPVKVEGSERYPGGYEPLSEACGQVKQMWEKSDFTGAPINLQIVARKYHDNELFGALALLKHNAFVMAAALNIVRQSLFAGSPRYTENDLPDLKGKVIAITGSNTGVGKEIAKMVYSKNAKVYMFARTTTKNEKARDEIKAAFPESRGELICIQLDLADLNSVQAAAAEFVSKEDKLHVLFNNAGVGFPEYGSKTKQGHELQLGVNCLGSFALTQRLTPVLVDTAKTSTPGTVRVVWASSTAAFWTSTTKYIERVKTTNKQSLFQQYAISKLGNYYHATEYAARHKSDGIISVPLNPGNLDSELWRTQGKFLTWILRKTVFYPPRYGGYVNIFAGFSPEVTLENSGRFISPWGRLWHALPAMVKGSKTEAEGGTGHARRFWEWTEEQVSQNKSTPCAKEPLR
ncbi:amidase signature domain-containing protein [Fusarium sp. MPI-SDFR-AT-0072]|nr:amidase signature domain-containing protein [Fusarium sp. MPI-SDFR-AT-0072]